MEKKNIARNITWDYARGIAIVMIVFHHLYPRFYNVPNFNPNSIIYLICYTCQLPIFMYISGLFANKSINRYGVIDLLRNRAVRLLLPFISFMLIWTIIYPKSFPSTFLENFKNGYWFTYVLFEMMALLSVSKWFANRAKTKSFYIIAITYVILTILKIAIPEKKCIINGIFSLNLLWHYFPYFILGYYSKKIDWMFQKRYAVIAFLVYAISIVYLQQSTIIPICNISSLILAVTLLTKGVRPFERLFSKIGFYSMQIYLLHFFTGILIKQIDLFDNTMKEFIFDITSTGLVITVCILVAKIIMKSELMAMYLFGIKKAQGSSHEAS